MTADGYFEKAFEEEQLEKLKASGQYYEEVEESISNEDVVKMSEAEGATKKDVIEAEEDFNDVYEDT